ncbi:MAG TPA: TRAFs-binding domain-containing protein [Terrimicrobiaceae bacterium]
MTNPLCFVLMPFGEKTDADGLKIDFDAVYAQLIEPAIEGAGLSAIRADEEVVGGIIHKPIFERLLLCEFAVADLTTASANVFYELGVRHAVLPNTTVLLFGGAARLPFDVALLRALPYQIDASGKPAHPSLCAKALTELLTKGRERKASDSPIFQLLENYPDIKRLKTDVFRDRVDYSMKVKNRLADARRDGLDAIRAIEAEFPRIADLESSVVIDLFLSYRAVKGWNQMIALVGKMSRPLAETAMVQEQLALALNRIGNGEQAENVLLNVIERRGPSSETYAILGRVYKDRWEAAKKTGNTALARGLLDKAITAYLKGFEADLRDAYPGVNAVTLMALREPPDPRKDELVPVVTYAVKRRIASGKPDYWDYATLLELAAIAEDEVTAGDALASALGAIREVWEPETTARNLRLIREARERRAEAKPWMLHIETELANKGRTHSRMGDRA